MQNANSVSISGGSVSGIMDLTLADGGTGTSLIDPNADRILFWDDSAGSVGFLTPSTNLAISTTNLNASSSGISNVVQDSTPQLGGQLDVNNNAIGDGMRELIKFTETASAVNEITITNAATGNGASISSTCNDANVNLLLVAKGTGVVKADGAEVVTLTGTQVLTQQNL